MAAMECALEKHGHAVPLWQACLPAEGLLQLQVPEDTSAVATAAAALKHEHSATPSPDVACIAQARLEGRAVVEQDRAALHRMGRARLARHPLALRGGARADEAAPGPLWPPPRPPAGS